MNYPSGSIDSIPIANAYAWELRPGTRPYVCEVDVAGDAEKLLSGKALPVRLELGSKSTVVDGVYVTSARPSDRPGKARVELRDRRWLWEYSWITRGYNVRRAVGVYRAVDPGAPLVIFPLQPEFAYAPWSLREQVFTWSAIEILKDVLKVLAGDEGRFNGSTFSVHVDSDLEKRVTSTPVENLEIDGTGADAVEAVLRYLPGVQLRVEMNGDVTLYSAIDGGDEVTASRLGPPLQGAPIPSRPSLARLRPSKFLVRFTYDCEVRFDFSDTGSDTSASPAVDSRYLENVAPVTDFSLTNNVGTVFCQDTWLQLELLLAAWGPAPFKSKARTMTKADVRRSMAPFMSLLTALQQGGLAQPDVNWPARVGAIQEHFRQTFRLPRRWLDKCLCWKASRIPTVNPTTATRGTAGVWTDFFYLPSTRSLYQDALGGSDLTYGTTVVGYPPDDLLASAGPRPPGVLTVLDEDQGIFRVDFRADASRMHEQSLPSKIEIDGENTLPGHFPKFSGPCGDATKQAERGVAFDAIVEGGAATVLTARHKLSVVITLTPAPGVGATSKAATDGKDPSFYEVEVTPGMVPGFAGVESCLGPPMVVHVGASIETARVAWSDDAAVVAAIESVFGLGAGGSAALRAQVVNDGPAAFPGLNPGARPPGDKSSPGVGASLQLIARAVAQRGWAVFSDRTIGAWTTVMDGNHVPRGWIDSVRHQVTQQGELLTTVNFPDRRRQFSINAFLDTATQRFIGHLANTVRS